MKKTWLSHTGVETLERCPRCFWLAYKKGIRQPEGIVSRLANRFDGVMKDYFDSYRKLGILPPMVKGKIIGKLQSPFVEKYFANINDRYGFLGKLDECLVDAKGRFIPVDFKTASTDPRQKDLLEAYKNQIDDYLFLLEKNGHKTAGYGYLIFVFPDLSHELHKGFPMIIHVVKVKGDPKKTEIRLKAAFKVLEGKMPKPALECPFCSWYEKMKKEVS